MIETTIYCYLTSKDAEEIAEKLRYIEKNAKIGDSKLAKVWTVDTKPWVKINFLVDQKRAEKQGLMK